MFLSLFFVACLAEQAKVVQTIRVTPGVIQDSVRLIGTVNAEKMITFVSQVSGTLTCFAKPGARVLKDALIMQLENKELLNTYTLSCEGEKIAHNQYARILELAKTKISSKQELEEKRHLWIEAQQKRLRAKIELDHTYFKAPFDGIVGVYKMREGAQI